MNSFEESQGQYAEVSPRPLGLEFFDRRLLALVAALLVSAGLVDGSALLDAFVMLLKIKDGVCGALQTVAPYVSVEVVRGTACALGGEVRHT